MSPTASKVSVPAPLKIQIRFENLTSRSKATAADSVTMQEVNDEELTLTLVGPAASCAKGHQLSIEIQVTGGSAPIKFKASGQAREVEKSGNGLRIVFHMIQFDRSEWIRLMASFNSASDRIQKLFLSMKE